MYVCLLQFLGAADREIQSFTGPARGDRKIEKSQWAMTYNDVLVAVENHGTAGSGLLTFGQLTATLRGIGEFFNEQARSGGDFEVLQGTNSVGLGYVGPAVGRLQCKR